MLDAGNADDRSSVITRDVSVYRDIVDMSGKAALLPPLLMPPSSSPPPSSSSSSSAAR